MSKQRRVVLLGATGSIGSQACDIFRRFPDRFRLVGASVGSDAAGLHKVVEEFSVPKSAIFSAENQVELPGNCGVGEDAICELAALECDVVCVAIPGAAAIRPALAAIDAGRDVALATKEVLVVAGEIVNQRMKKSGSCLFPVDSEHSALWQCLRGEEPSSVSRLILTASGGPFRDRPLDSLHAVTPAEALAHPNWDMGPKVTIDSATMMNKGLEVIEAHHLFAIPYEKIDVVIHPSSTVHSMVEFCDGATMAQIGIPDMRIPIALALTAGERLPGICSPADVVTRSPLEFSKVDDKRFPAVLLARKAGTQGGSAPAVLNAANEVAVAAFLQGRLAFDAIVPTVANAVSAASASVSASLDDLFAMDKWARSYVAGLVDSAVTA